MTTVGANFKRGSDTTKTVTCELNEASSWVTNKVVLTVTRTGTEETATCTSGTTDNGFPSTCVYSATNPNRWTIIGDDDSIKAAIAYTGTETAAFRCDVTVDEEASDSKLVYAETLGKYIE